MLRAAWFIARKDVQYMLRERETLLWTFIMPIIFFFFIGTITGGFAGDDSPDRPDPLVLDSLPEPVSSPIISPHDSSGPDIDSYHRIA
jgi:hypothetical protein